MFKSGVVHPSTLPNGPGLPHRKTMKEQSQEAADLVKSIEARRAGEEFSIRFDPKKGLSRGPGPIVY